MWPQQTMAVVTRVVPADARGPALGVWGAVGSIASLVGPVVGGFIISIFGWRGVFFLHLPLGIAALILSALWVPKLPTYARSIDKLSVVVSLVGKIGRASGREGGARGGGGGESG